MTLYREDIRANRQKWIDYLLLPTTKAARGVLARGPNDNSRRCCLGHGCHVLGFKVFDAKSERAGYGYKTNSDAAIGYAPAEMVEAMGMYDSAGVFRGMLFETTYSESLVDMNDSEKRSPQEIGEFLARNINGGGPFKPLDDYPSRETQEIKDRLDDRD